MGAIVYFNSAIIQIIVGYMVLQVTHMLQLALKGRKDFGMINLHLSQISVKVYTGKEGITHL